jgi:hypothetical protein
LHSYGYPAARPENDVPSAIAVRGVEVGSCGGAPIVRVAGFRRAHASAGTRGHAQRRASTTGCRPGPGRPTPHAPESRGTVPPHAARFPDAALRGAATTEAPPRRRSPLAPPPSRRAGTGHARTSPPVRSLTRSRPRPTCDAAGDQTIDDTRRPLHPLLDEPGSLDDRTPRQRLHLTRCADTTRRGPAKRLAKRRRVVFVI